MNRQSWYERPCGLSTKPPNPGSPGRSFSALAPALARPAQKRAQQELDDAPGVGLDLHGDGHARGEGDLLAVDLEPRPVEAQPSQVGERSPFAGHRVARYRRDAAADTAVPREGESLDLH